MTDQLSLFDGAGNTAPRRWLGTGEHNGELVVEEIERFERNEGQWMRGRIVAHYPKFDVWLRPIGGVAAGKVAEWKEMGE